MGCGFRQSQTHRRATFKSKAVRRSPPGSRGVDQAWPRAEQGADEKAGVVAAVRAGDREVQGRRPRLAVSHRSGPATDQQDQVGWVELFAKPITAIECVKYAQIREVSALPKFPGNGICHKHARYGILAKRKGTRCMRIRARRTFGQTAASARYMR